MNGNGNAGIFFAPTASSSLFVSHTVVSDNGFIGIYVISRAGSSTVLAVFNDVEANNNEYGIVLGGDDTSGAIKATATGTVAAGNILLAFMLRGVARPRSCWIMS